MNFIFSLLLASVMWVQVPQWEADWSKCAVDVPDASCLILQLQKLIFQLHSKDAKSVIWQLSILTCGYA